MSELSHYEKRGYLHDDFKIFHLKDTSMRPIDFHYHDFHKILIFRKGNISYTVEMRGDLDSRMNDEEDFIDISVWALQEMLERAHQLGLSDARK